MDWAKKCLDDFNAGKTQLVLFEWSNNIGLLMQKWMGPFLTLFRMGFFMAAHG